jgi:hypothetical protein
MIVEKVAILQSVGTFAGKLGDEEEVNCPACGRSIPIASFEKTRT